MMTRLCGPLGGTLISHKPVDNFANAVNVIYAHRFPFPRIPSHERFFPRNETKRGEAILPRNVEIFFKVVVIDRREMEELRIRNILSAKRIEPQTMIPDDSHHQCISFLKRDFSRLSFIKLIDKSYSDSMKLSFRFR